MAMLNNQRVDDQILGLTLPGQPPRLEHMSSPSGRTRPGDTAAVLWAESNYNHQWLTMKLNHSCL